jgi:glycosyltransferase involved in cell wall biosynthesis
VVVGPEFPWVDEAAAAYGVADAVRSLGYLPHASALQEVARADAGLIVLADVPGSRGIYSSKLFEYLGVGVPVLLVGPRDCAAADVVRESGAGTVASVGDTDEIARAIVALADAKAAGRPALQADPRVVRRFDRKAQVDELSQIIVGTIGTCR